MRLPVQARDRVAVNLLLGRDERLIFAFVLVVPAGVVEIVGVDVDVDVSADGRAEVRDRLGFHGVSPGSSAAASSRRAMRRAIMACLLPRPPRFGAPSNQRRGPSGAW